MDKTKEFPLNLDIIPEILLRIHTKSHLIASNCILNRNALLYLFYETRPEKNKDPNILIEKKS